MKSITRRLMTLAITLAFTLTLAIIAAPLTTNAETSEIVQEITVSLPGENLEIMFTNVWEITAISQYSDPEDYYLTQYRFFLPSNGTFTLSRDVDVFLVEVEFLESGGTLDIGVPELFLTLEGGKQYTYSDYDKSLVDFPGDSPNTRYVCHIDAGFLFYSLEESREGIFERYETVNEYLKSSSAGWAYLLVDVSTLSVDTPEQITNSDNDKASEWAREEVQLALDAGIVPDAISQAGWQNATNRLVAAEAIVSAIEVASDKTMTQIAAERGWDLSRNAFSDTNSQAVTFLRYAGVTTGVGDNRYDPGASYTRAAIVTMIGRAAEEFFGITAQGANPFTDVPDWAAPFVGYAADNGITTGVGGGRFDSDGVLQNQQTAIFCYRALNAWK